jgi:ubiquitin C-terminal hydrolase
MLALESPGDAKSAVGADVALHSQVCAHEVLLALLMRLEEAGVSIATAFGVQLVRTSKCPSCGHCETAAEPASSAVELYPQPGDSSVQGVLNSWLKPERIEGWPCRQALCLQQDRIKQLAMRGDAAPPALVLHVGRIAWDCSVGAMGASRRVNSGLDVDEVLHLATHVRASGNQRGVECDVSYVFDAAVLHVGTTTGSGHYTYVARINGVFWLCNDGRKPQSLDVAAAAALMRNTAVILLYSRRD